MKIKILGCRGEISLKKRNYSKHSGILIDNKILMDVGEKAFLNAHPKIILLTHFHPDHAFFVRKKEKINFVIPAYAPEHLPNASGLKIMKKTLRINSYKITPIPTLHSIKFKSQGYILEKSNKRIFYTGDLLGIEKKYLRRLKNIDIVITEASFFKKGGMIRRHPDRGGLYGHAGVKDLIDLFRPFTRHIVFSHFGNWFIEDIRKGKRRIKELEKAQLKLETAYDGKIIHI